MVSLGGIRDLKETDVEQTYLEGVSLNVVLFLWNELLTLLICFIVVKHTLHQNEESHILKRTGYFK